jgi:hypothetical protein
MLARILGNEKTILPLVITLTHGILVDQHAVRFWAAKAMCDNY